MNSALYSGYLTLLPDIQCDLAYAVEGNSNTYGDFWLWKIRPTDLLIQDVYAQLYAVIGACNFYLDRIDAVMARETSDANLETLDQYTGEVYAIRALCYSELLKCFCEAYDPATAEQQQGVVLRTKYFEKEPVRRATLYDSYKFVLDDLTRADELLDDAEDTPNNYYMSEAAVQAIRARRGSLHAGLGRRHRVLEHPARRQERHVPPRLVSGGCGRRSQYVRLHVGL